MERALHAPSASRQLDMVPLVIRLFKHRIAEQSTQTTTLIQSLDGFIASNDNECAICLQGLSNLNTDAPNCGHLFHARCLSRHIRSRAEPWCPICREPLEPNRLTRIISGLPDPDFPKKVEKALEALRKQPYDSFLEKELDLLTDVINLERSAIFNKKLDLQEKVRKANETVQRLQAELHTSKAECQRLRTDIDARPRPNRGTKRGCSAVESSVKGPIAQGAPSRVQNNTARMNGNEESANEVIDLTNGDSSEYAELGNQCLGSSVVMAENEITQEETIGVVGEREEGNEIGLESSEGVNVGTVPGHLDPLEHAIALISRRANRNEENGNENTERESRNSQGLEGVGSMGSWTMGIAESWWGGSGAGESGGPQSVQEGVDTRLLRPLELDRLDWGDYMPQRSGRRQVRTVGCKAGRRGRRTT